MSCASSTAGLLAVAALLSTGCSGIFQLRNVGIGGEASAAETPKAAVGNESPNAQATAALPAKTTASLPEFETRAAAVSSPAEGVPDARLQEALESLRSKNPDKYAAVKKILEQPDPNLPAPLHQYLRDQCVAVLLKTPTQQQAAGVHPGGETAAKAVTRLEQSAPPIVLSPTRLVSAAGTAGTQGATESITDRPALVPATQTMADPADRRVAEDKPETTTSKSVKEQLATDSAKKAEAAAEVEPGNWETQLAAAIGTLEKQLTQPGSENPNAARLEASLRLLYAIANRREQAVAPIDGLGDDERDYWKHQLFGLLVSLDAEGMNAASRRAALALRELREATDSLSNMSTLDVRGLAFCSRVESYGRYTEFKSNAFRPAEEVLLYVEIENFAVEKAGDQYETELQGSYDIFDAQGVRIANVVLPRDQQLCNNRRHDYFIAYRLHLPPQISPGSYRLQLTIEDVKGKKSNQASIDFRIR